MTKKSRHKKIMSIQKQISKKNLEQKLGNVYKAMIENISFDRKILCTEEHIWMFQKKME